MKRLCEGYIQHAKLVGALYSIVPTIIWGVILLALNPFRSVYPLRIVISLVIGGAMGALLNELGLRLWLIKHRSKEGPGAVSDGAFIGAAIGLGATFIPSLTSLIATNHPKEAMMFVIGSWLAGILIGAMTGSILAAIGREHLSRDERDS